MSICRTNRKKTQKEKWENKRRGKKIQLEKHKEGKLRLKLTSVNWKEEKEEKIVKSSTASVDENE